MSQSDGIPPESYAYAEAELSKGCRPEDIRRCLIDSGHTEAQAAKIMRSVLPPQHFDSSAPDISTGGSGGGWNSNMVIGAIVCVVGIVVTVGSLMAAQGGGSYVVAWGAIVFGAIQFFRGAAQKGQEMQPPHDPTQQSNYR